MRLLPLLLLCLSSLTSAQDSQRYELGQRAGALVAAALQYDLYQAECQAVERKQLAPAVDRLLKRTIGIGNVQVIQLADKQAGVNLLKRLQAQIRANVEKLGGCEAAVEKDVAGMLFKQYEIAKDSYLSLPMAVAEAFRAQVREKAPASSGE